MIRISRLLFFFLILAAPSFGFAQSIPNASDLPTGHRPDSGHFWNASAIGYNQLVFGDQFKLYRKMPWGEGKTLLTSDSHWRLGTHTTISPAYSRPAALIGVSPLLIMDLDVHYGPAYNVLQHTYHSYNDEYDPKNLGKVTSYGFWFHQAEANCVLKAAVWKLAALNLTDFTYFYSKDYFFNWEAATIVRKGYALRNKTFLLYEVVPNWRLFANYENYNYFPSSFMTELGSGGLVFTKPSFHNFTTIVQLGWHIHNTKFYGVKFWAVAIMEWDWPDHH